jgi:hypothetical protein
MPREKRGGDLGHAERNALVALPGIQDRIDGKEPDGVRQALANLA